MRETFFSERTATAALSLCCLKGTVEKSQLFHAVIRTNWLFKHIKVINSTYNLDDLSWPHPLISNL